MGSTQLPTDGTHPLLLEVICINIIKLCCHYVITTDYEGVSEVWQLVPSDMFSLISIPFQGKSVKVGVSNDHVMLC